MPDEELMTPKAVKALQAEIRVDEHAARVRDYGEAGATDCETGRDEAYRMQAEALGLEPRQMPPVPAAEIDQAVGDLERGWPNREDAGYEQMLADKAASAAPGRAAEKERQR